MHLRTINYPRISPSTPTILLLTFSLQTIPMPDSICICGAGTMGSGIAQSAAQHGIPVILYDMDPAKLSRTWLQIEKDLQQQVAKKRIRFDDKKEIIHRIRFTTVISECQAGIVLEAIVENTEAKVSLFTELEKLNGLDTLFVSNSSSLSIKAIAERTAFPDRIMGMHFFNPANRMKLVEIIRTNHSNEASVQRIRDLAVLMGKTPVICKDASGVYRKPCCPPFLPGSAPAGGKRNCGHRNH